MNDAGVRDHLRDALLGAGQSVAVDACEREDIDMILIYQHSFSHSMQDILTLGTLIKYAGANGKKIVVALKPDSEETEDE